MTGNQLKILALAAMTIDHIGVVLLPHVLWLRIVGRLALPVFAYMIAEGCFYTRNKARYLGGIVALGALCQAVYWFAEGSMEQSILTTFALSIITVYALQWWWGQRTGARILAPLGALAFCAFTCYALPALLAGSGFRIDYGFWGVMLSVLCYLPRLNMTREQAKEETPVQARSRRLRMLALLGAGLVALALSMLNTLGGVQWWGLAALVPLALYNGQRGAWNLKYLFYIYYPAHLAAIYGISLLV